MDLLPIGSKSRNILTIENEYVSVTIKGAIDGPKYTAKENGKTSRVLVKGRNKGKLFVLDEELEPVALNKYADGDEYTYNVEPLFYEERRYVLYIVQKQNDVSPFKSNRRISFKHSNRSIDSSIVTPLEIGNTVMLTGDFTFGSECGYSRFDIYWDDEPKPCLSFDIEVFPSKLEYKEDYDTLLEEVKGITYNLIFDFLKETYKGYNVGSTAHNSPVEFFAIVSHIFEDLLKAADLILLQPHHQLAVEHEVLARHKVKRVDGQGLKWLNKHPQYIKCRYNGINAERALAVKKYVTYDTKENRFFKFILENVAKRLLQFKDCYCHSVGSNVDQRVAKIVDEMVRSIRARTQGSFLREIEAQELSGTMSLVYAMAPGYRDLLKNYILLLRGLTVNTDLFDISIKDLWLLYEYWCFVKLNSILKDELNCKLESSSFIKVNGRGVSVTLVKGKNASMVKYRYKGNIITLSYNEAEQGTPTTPQKPDNVLSLDHKDGLGRLYKYIFDAKYRIDVSGQYGEGPAPVPDTINTMHRYRDAIVVEKDGKYERQMYGAYVLFPLAEERNEVYKKHKFYESIDKVNIGGLPFLPNNTDLVRDFLKVMIEK